MSELDIVLLYKAQNEAEAGMIAEVLRDAGIECLVKTQGAGFLYQSSILMGVDVCVAADQHEEAKELIEGYFNASEFVLDGDEIADVDRVESEDD